MIPPTNPFLVTPQVKRRVIDRLREAFEKSPNLAWEDGLDVQVKFFDDVVQTEIGRVRIKMTFEMHPYAKPWWKLW